MGHDKGYEGKLTGIEEGRVTDLAWLQVSNVGRSQQWGDWQLRALACQHRAMHA